MTWKRLMPLTGEYTEDWFIEAVERFHRLDMAEPCHVWMKLLETCYGPAVGTMGGCGKTNFRMLKKAVRQGRSERRGEAYALVR